MMKYQRNTREYHVIISNIILPQKIPDFNELTFMICGVFVYDFGLFRAIYKKRER